MHALVKETTPNPSVERTSDSEFCLLSAAAHFKR
jgi:hypothetical protein